MQFRKTTKKTTNAEESGAPVSETNTAGESMTKPRTSRSSKLKKETPDTGSARHRRSTAAESSVDNPQPLKAAAAAAGDYSSASDSSIIDSVGVLTPAGNRAGVATRSTEISPSHEEIANLAYSFWVARGYGHGSPEQDWLRAEQELRSRR
jgi:hypothetical protein